MQDEAAQARLRSAGSTNGKNNESALLPHLDAVARLFPPQSSAVLFALILLGFLIPLSFPPSALISSQFSLSTCSPPQSDVPVGFFFFRPDAGLGKSSCAGAALAPRVNAGSAPSAHPLTSLHFSERLAQHSARGIL